MMDLPVKKTVDLTPTWEGIVNEFERVNPYQKPEGRRAMWAELRKMARHADAFNEAIKNGRVSDPDESR